MARDRLVEVSSGSATCSGLRSKNLPDVGERMVQGAKVSRGRAVEVVVEDFALDFAAVAGVGAAARKRSSVERNEDVADGRIVVSLAGLCDIVSLRGVSGEV